MTPGTIDRSERTAARVVGLAYLLALPPALFAELYARGQLIVINSVADTARNIMENERLFRIPLRRLLSVDGEDRPPEVVFRKISPTGLKALMPEEAWVHKAK